jgi:hypothetical protein
VYPHDLPEGIVAQQYAPDAVAGRAYYNPTTHGMEARFGERYGRIRAILHGQEARDGDKAPQGEVTQREAAPQGEITPQGAASDEGNDGQ